MFEFKDKIDKRIIRIISNIVRNKNLEQRPERRK